MRYRLRTLLILLAVVPPLLAGAWLFWPRARIFKAIGTKPDGTIIAVPIDD